MDGARRHRVRLRQLGHDDRPVALAKLSPQTELVLADPVGSILAEYINDGTLNESPAAGWWKASARTSCRRSPTSAGSRRPMPSAMPSFHTARELLARKASRRFVHRHPAGRGAAYCREQTTPRRVVVLVRHRQQVPVEDVQRLLDAGQRLPRARVHGDLRDLILRPYSQRDTVVVGPNDLLTTAYQRMKLYDVSQLPVMDGDKLVGILDESDVLLRVRRRSPLPRPGVHGDGDAAGPVDVKSPIEALLPVFDRGQVAIVSDGEAFLGLITRIDLLNYLRRRVQ
jgi:cystathionine beta-synthase